MRVLLAVLALLASFVSGCGKKPPVLAPQTIEVVRTVTVDRPVPFRVQAPPELLQPLKVPIPVFVAPSDPQASSALTVENERLLRALIESLLGQIRAWQVWATAEY